MSYCLADEYVHGRWNGKCYRTRPCPEHDKKKEQESSDYDKTD